jgi:beta-phosphoglucomutase-like phosphatase (HAD superfamily)
MADMDKTSGASSAHQRALLVEMDLVGLSGTELLLQACTARLEKEGIKLDRSLFQRYLLGKTPARGMSALLEKIGKSSEGSSALAAECVEAYVASLQAAARIRDNLVAFLKDVVGHGVKVGLLTQMSESAAKERFADLLANPLVQVIVEPANHSCVHGWEGWRRAARKVQVGERLCVALATPASARGALSASMRMVVVLDPLQEHLDCSGADVVTESITPAVRNAALRLLKIEETR